MNTKKRHAEEAVAERPEKKAATAAPSDDWILISRVFPREQSKGLFDSLVRKMPTERKPLGVYGGALEPRFSCFYAVDGHRYRYSKLTHVTSDELESEVYVLLRTAFNHTGIVFDVILFNYYANGRHYVSPHFDADAMNTAVGSFSFGGVRTFRIFRGHDPSPTVSKHRVADLPLTDGSFMLMKEEFQQKYKHSLPSVANAEPRVNGTCRQHNIELCQLLTELFRLAELEPLGASLLLIARYLHWSPLRVYR